MGTWWLFYLKKHQIHSAHPHVQDESINIPKAEGRIIKSIGDTPSKGRKCCCWALWEYTLSFSHRSGPPYVREREYTPKVPNNFLIHNSTLGAMVMNGYNGHAHTKGHGMYSHIQRMEHHNSFPLAEWPYDGEKSPVHMPANLFVVWYTRGRW